MDRRTFLTTGALACTGAIAGYGFDRAVQEPLEIIDCHTHFYDSKRPQGVPWPDKGSPLYRTVLPKDLRQLKQYRPVTGTVIVEASEWVEDNQWLLDLAKNEPFIVGIVGRLEPDSSEFESQIRRFSKSDLFRGIRVLSPKVSTLVDRDDIKPFQLLDQYGLTLDINGGPDTPLVINKLSKKVPGLKIVLNHIANVAVTRDPPPSEWKSAIDSLRSLSNVFCKISALVEGAARDGNKAPKELDFYRPTIDVVWNAFGEDRVIYGSNWPVCELAADYATVQSITMDYALEHGESALKKFCSMNASRAYRWIDRPGR